MKKLSALLFAAFLGCMAPAADLPLLIAHRGASHAAPENTLAAFKLAWTEGADGIEGDFHLTADGEVVCLHDADTRRTAGTKRVVAASKWSELAALDVGSWKSPAFKGERIPRLADVLDALPPGKRFFLEIKAGPEIVGPIRRILEAKEADPARVTMISFDAGVIAACRKAMPAYAAHWISDLKDFNRADYDRMLAACGSQGLQFKAAAATDAAWFAALRARGLQLTSWTVDDPALARKMIGLGVNHITTNRPGPLRGELTE
jgi:glycerophosphoryl diester phosphodiesterase